jgi:uncharacterized protein involved in exopolysaccharide biosynthesis
MQDPKAVRAVYFSPRQESSLRDILYVLFRHKWKIVIFFVAMWATMTFLALTAKDFFQSEAKVLVKIGRNAAADPSVTGPMLSVLTTSKAEVNSEMAILRSESILEDVIDGVDVISGISGDPNEGVVTKHIPGLGVEHIQNRLDEAGRLVSTEEGKTGEGKKKAAWQVLLGKLTLDSFLKRLGLTPDLTPRASVLAHLREGFEVSVPEESNVINIQFKTVSPALSKEVLDTLVSIYRIRHIQAHKSQSADTNFFVDRVKESERKMLEAEKELESFRTRFNIVSLEEQKKALLTHIMTLRNELSNGNAEMKGAQERVTSLEKSLEGRPEYIEVEVVDGLPNFGKGDIKQQLVDLKVAEAEVGRRYQEGARAAVQARKKVEAVEDFLATEPENYTNVTTGVNRAYQDIDAKLQEAKATLAACLAKVQPISQELEARERELDELNKHSVTLDQLDRTVKVNEKEYLEYRSSYQRSVVLKDLDKLEVGNVEVIQKATLPSAPLGLNRVRRVILGFFLGLFGGIALAFFCEFIDNTIKTNEDVDKHLGLPVLATVTQDEYKSCQ